MVYCKTIDGKIYFLTYLEMLFVAGKTKINFNNSKT